jgi:hypothetical protein
MQNLFPSSVTSLVPGATNLKAKGVIGKCEAMVQWLYAGGNQRN